LGRVYNYIYHRTGSVSEAEDLTERVFLQALAHLPSYTYRGLPFSVWLFRIAHNVLANWYRDHKRRQTVSIDDQVASGDEPADAAIDELDIEDAAMLRKAVAGLSPERQQLILLKFVEELPHAEIGQIMGRSEGAVKALLHRTLKALKKDLQEGVNGYGAQRVS
jgi:RNA polymerase sigma-70 factor (ECF subfamily)